MIPDITICGLTFVFVTKIPISISDHSAYLSTYRCSTVPLTLEFGGGYYPRIFPTNPIVHASNGDWREGEITGYGDTYEDAMKGFFVKWNKHLPRKLAALRGEVSALETFDAAFKQHAKVVIEPTVEELKAEIERLKAVIG